MLLNAWNPLGAWNLGYSFTKWSQKERFQWTIFAFSYFSMWSDFLEHKVQSKWDTAMKSSDFGWLVFVCFMDVFWGSWEDQKMQDSLFKGVQKEVGTIRLKQTSTLLFHQQNAFKVLPSHNRNKCALVFVKIHWKLLHRTKPRLRSALMLFQPQQNCPPTLRKSQHPSEIKLNPHFSLCHFCILLNNEIP